MFQPALTLPSFAKINWQLRVFGRRPDGFHELRTTLQTVTLHDRIRFLGRDDGQIRLTSDSPDIPVDERNLIVRAANALRNAYGSSAGVSIHLEKVIPVQGGLGGGSSNAAIALLGLAHLWRLKTTREELAELAKPLGADVPFFFTGGTATGTGIGDEISPCRERVAEHLLIVHPSVKVETADAYGALNSPALTKDYDPFILSSSRADEQLLDSSPDALHNDFERVIFSVKPEIRRVKDALLDAGARSALLAGSGSSVFGVFDNGETLQRTIETLKNQDAWRVFPCSTISRGEYMAALGACAIA